MPRRGSQGVRTSRAMTHTRRSRPEGSSASRCAAHLPTAQRCTQQEPSMCILQFPHGGSCKRLLPSCLTTIPSSAPHGLLAAPHAHVLLERALHQAGRACVLPLAAAHWAASRPRLSSIGSMSVSSLSATCAHVTMASNTNGSSAPQYLMEGSFMRTCQLTASIATWCQRFIRGESTHALPCWGLALPASWC